MSSEEERLVGQLKEAQASAVESILEEEKSLERVIHVVENTEWFASEIRKKYLDSRTQKIACKKKCHWCCHQYVSITVPEALRICKHINEEVSNKEKSKFVNSLRNLHDEIKGLNSTQRAKADKPCAFLSFGVCGIYKVRPLLCQRQTSFSLEECKKAKPQGFPFGSITEEKAQQLTYSAVILGMREGLEKTLPKSDHRSLELTSGVLGAIDGSLILGLWLEGEKASGFS